MILQRIWTKCSIKYQNEIQKYVIVFKKELSVSFIDLS